MDAVVVVSVERSGTHFAARVCRELTGATGSSWIHGLNGAGPGKIWSTHLYEHGFSKRSDDVLAHVLGRTGFKRVVPVRHPLRVLISKQEQGKEPASTLDIAHGLARMPFVDGHFLQIDVERELRGAETGRLAEFLGVKPKTVSWKRANPTPELKHGPLRQLYQQGEDVTGFFTDELAIIEPVRPFFEEFGYTW